MHATLIRSAAALALVIGGGAALSGPAQAAHAGAPYANVDRHNDAGNDTGDSQVERLNQEQLDKIGQSAPMSPGTDAPATPAMPSGDTGPVMKPTQ